MIVRLLGPVEVVGPGGRAVLQGARQRALVGALALNAGTAVAGSRLVAALWGEDPPRTAVKTLHGHVARLRRALDRCGLPDRLLTVGSSYRLAVTRADVDCLQFEDRVAAARAREPGSAEPLLREAIALWRGDPLQDSELCAWGAAEKARLEELRLNALEQLWDAQLRLGDQGPAVADLERVLLDHPLRERLVELQMRTLYRSGRPAEALAAYQTLRTRLVDELGMDPGPELQRIYTAILRSDEKLAVVERPGPAFVRPVQLPARVGHFTGRLAQLRALDRVLDQAADTRIAVVYGAGGMGKTAAVVQWGQGVRDRFPDGQLFIDLRGYDERAAMTAAEALTHVVRALGVPEARIPGELPELTNLFRSVVDGRRLLMVLDNAVDADQVRPLVPPSPETMLVVTSRSPLAALSTYHAVHSVRLDALSPVESLRLLRDVVGADRADWEAVEAERIVACCAGMPLALRVAAARLVQRPGWPLGAFAAELSTVDALDALRVDGDSRTVRAVFASSYRSLSQSAASLFRRLGLHPGGEFGRHLAAAVTDLPAAATDRALAELVDAYLLTEAGGRYRYHDLIRLYAAECARRDEDPAVRESLVSRIIDWYVGIADVANRVLDPSHDRVRPTLSHPPAAVPFAADHQGTLTFLDEERPNLVPVVSFAVHEGQFGAAWQLTYLLTGFFDSRGRWGDRIEMCRLGLTAAQRLGDPTAEALMGSALGTAYLRMLRFTEALDCLRPALELACAIGDRRSEGHIRNNIATAYGRMRRYDEAVEIYEQALAVHRASGTWAGIAAALTNIGIARFRQGLPQRGVDHLTEALRVIREHGDQRLEAMVLGYLGEARLGQDRSDAALDAFQQALEIQQAIGDRRHEVDTLVHIGLIWLAERGYAPAGDHLRAALRVSRDLDDPHLVSVCLNHLAAVHLRHDDTGPAGEYLRQALAIRTGIPDAYEEAAIYRNLADLALRTGRQAVADDHRQRAIGLYRKANAPTEAAELESVRPGRTDAVMSR